MNTWEDPNLSSAERVEALLSEMTLHEKLHQLGSFWMRNEAKSIPAPDPNSGVHDVAPMESQFKADHAGWEETIDGGLGHITRNYGTAPLTVRAGREKLIALQKQVRAANRFNLPAIVHEECLTGLTAFQATVYPAAIAWGAAWNPELVQEMANRIGSDMSSLGIHQGLAPLLDVVRDYRWGRVEETCGEDPYLVGCIGTSYVRGLQNAGVSATLKHFAGYSASRGGRNHAPVSMGRREFEDYLLPPFEMAVRSGYVDAVMNSYADIDGVPAAASYFLLTEVLRKRWGFEGYVVSDYWTVKFLQNMHRIVASKTDAGVAALKAGLDVELPETVCYYGLEEAVRDGRLSEDTVNEAVRRVLRIKLKHGLLDADWNQESQIDADTNLDSDLNRVIAKKMAEESIILLKNDGILPLERDLQVSVIGPIWTEVRSFMGCYSFPNHVLTNYPELGLGINVESLPQTLPHIFNHAPQFVCGTGFQDGSDVQIAEAVEAAKNADIALVTLGDIAGMFGGGTSGEGCDAADLNLPGRQGELLEAILDTGTPTVLLLVTGRPYAIGKYADRCKAIIQAFMPGAEAAETIAKVLAGEVNPSGHLPIAIPNTPGGQPGTYLTPPLGWESEGISNIDPRPKYAFGHGLSYTSFALSDFAVSQTNMSLDGVCEVSVKLKNTGERVGAQVVQLYASDPVAEVVRPRKQLIGFAKVELDPGKSALINFQVHADRFSFTGLDLKRIVEGGEIQLSVGFSSEDLRAQQSINLLPGRREVGEGRVLFTPVTVMSLSE